LFKIRRLTGGCLPFKVFGKIPDLPFRGQAFGGSSLVKRIFLTAMVSFLPINGVYGTVAEGSGERIADRSFGKGRYLFFISCSAIKRGLLWANSYLES